MGTDRPSGCKFRSLSLTKGECDVGVEKQLLFLVHQQDRHVLAVIFRIYAYFEGRKHFIVAAIIEPEGCPGMYAGYEFDLAEAFGKSALAQDDGGIKEEAVV